MRDAVDIELQFAVAVDGVSVVAGETHVARWRPDVNLGEDADGIGGLLDDNTVGSVL